MFCPECGSKNADGAVFCENCGASLQRTGAASSAPVKKEREPLNAKEKLLLIEIAVAIVSVILLIVVYNVQFSAKSVAKKHVEALMDMDYEKVYDTMLVKGSGDFMTKEAFLTAIAFEEVEDEKIDGKVTAVQKRSGDLTSQKMRVRVKTDDDSEKIELKLKRDGLFWKVDTKSWYIEQQGDKLIQKYSIAVPKGADVFVDKINISDTMKPSEKIADMDTYTIDAVFGPTHYVEISGKDIEKSGQLVTWTGGDPSFVQSAYNEKTVEKLAEQAMEDWQVIMDAALNYKRFSDVELLQNMNSTNKDMVIGEFESTRDYDFGGDDSGSTQVDKYQFTNGEVNITTAQEEGETLAYVDVKGNFYYSSYSTYWSSTPYHNEDNGQTKSTLTYIMENGKWVLYNLDLSPFYD